MRRFYHFISKLRARCRGAIYQQSIRINRSTDPTILVVGAVAPANHLPTMTRVVLAGVVGHG